MNDYTERELQDALAHYRGERRAVFALALFGVAALAVLLVVAAGAIWGLL